MFLRQVSNIPVGMTFTDIAIAVYLLYGGCNLLFVRDIPLDMLFLRDWMIYVLLYIGIRNIGSKNLVVWSVIGVGLIQAIIGMIQWLGWFASNHPDFLATGTFQNPGPYGGLLAVSFVAAVWMFCRTTRFRVFLWGILFMLLIMLVVSNSRASWLAVLIGVIALFPKFYRGLTKKITLVATMGIVLGCLYFLRPGSADARLLIWQVCMGLVDEAPLFGHGIGTLSLYYMSAQADYFAIHPYSELSLVANNNYQAFNEFLHVFVEQGVVGFVLLFCIIFTCRRSSYFSLVLVWFVFSMFSYPADCGLLMVVLVLCIALCAENGSVWNMTFNRKWLLCGLLVLPFVFVVTWEHGHAIKRIESDNAPRFPYNREYMLQFAGLKQDINILEALTRNVCSSTDILCDMGGHYEMQGNVKKADSCYTLARQMVPCRMIPLYRLYLLYENRDSIVARKYARQILDFKSPLIGSVVVRARADAKKYLNYE